MERGVSPGVLLFLFPLFLLASAAVGSVERLETDGSSILPKLDDL